MFFKRLSPFQGIFTVLFIAVICAKQYLWTLFIAILFCIHEDYVYYENNCSLITVLNEALPFRFVCVVYGWFHPRVEGLMDVWSCNEYFFSIILVRFYSVCLFPISRLKHLQFAAWHTRIQWVLPSHFSSHHWSNLFQFSMQQFHNARVIPIRILIYMINFSSTFALLICKLLLRKFCNFWQLFKS